MHARDLHSRPSRLYPPTAASARLQQSVSASPAGCTPRSTRAPASAQAAPQS
jgi:hypothetical protein